MLTDGFCFSYANSLSCLAGGKSLTQRWENGELTNFQYLMHLNTLAGRSYNDLNQYPVFPWIIADYDSEVLDLSDACSYRDLSKPMGAQTPLRAQAFAQRYNTWEDVTEDKTPPFHYGTHYSSAAIVSSYLVRMEPFTQLFLKLQGGHFDHPDRMFYSIKDAWLSASEKNNGDVKELIPEFFYLPEFLNNTNHFDLGTKQSGQVLHDVLLPPWAKGNPHEFVRLHREALESEYVSSRLHEWIDLVFGHKQQVSIVCCENKLRLGGRGRGVISSQLMVSLPVQPSCDVVMRLLMYLQLFRLFSFSYLDELSLLAGWKNCRAKKHERH